MTSSRSSGAPGDPLRAFEEVLGGSCTGDAALIEGLERALAAGHAAHPAVVLDDETFARALASVVAQDKGASPAASLSRIHVADLFLARAAVAGDPVAQRSVESLHLSRVREWVSHVDRNEAFAADMQQEAARRLLIEDEREPKLLGYTGRGALGAFIRVFVTRLARKHKRRSSEKGHSEPSEALQAPDLDPEIALLKKRYAREFSDALQRTLLTLDADERNVLKLHYIDGLSIEEVGAAYNVSRATAARWLQKARLRVVDETQRVLSDRLGASAPHAASLLALVRSQLDASLIGLLGR
jgi:RNA polymerase sigma-70 factor (ECF subfamily)